MYNKERFPGVVYKTKIPKTAALIFGSGKIVCTGAKSIADAGIGLSNVFEKLREMAVDILDKPEIKIHAIIQFGQNCDNRRQETRGCRSCSRENSYRT